MLMQVGAMTWFLKWEGRYKCGVGLEMVRTIMMLMHSGKELVSKDNFL